RRHGAAGSVEERRVLCRRRRLGAHERGAAQADRRFRPPAFADRAAARPRGAHDRLAHAARDRGRDPRRPHRPTQRHRPRKARAQRRAQTRIGDSMNPRFTIGVVAVLAACAGAAFAQAPAYPSHPVTVVVPYAPGGLPDTVARVVGQKLGEKWGQAVVIENKPGGNGVVAAQYVMAKPADGYTLLVSDNTMFSVNPFIYSKLPYDPVKDFTIISLTATAPLFLAIHPSVQVSNFTEWVALVKSKPGQFSYGSSGIGSIHHLTVESIKSALGLD